MTYIKAIYTESAYSRLGSRTYKSGKEIKMKILRKIVTINEEKCDGCGLCTEACAEGAIRIINGKAKLIADKYCDGLGACLGECPQGAIDITEREAEAFDETAVEAHLHRAAPSIAEDLKPLACGCPSAHIETFSKIPSQGMAEKPVLGESSQSELTHWPVQIRLVPPTAPFLEGADLLVAADCTPVTYERFHQDFLKGRIVLMGCPKFDDQEAYIDKFAQIFQKADVKGITVLVMEVPCCQGLPAILQRAMERAGKEIPLKRMVITTRGTIAGTMDMH